MNATKPASSPSGGDGGRSDHSDGAGGASHLAGCPAEHCREEPGEDGAVQPDKRALGCSGRGDAESYRQRQRNDRDGDSG